ncbi:unnamed protein product [Schistosoma margrebowiei]|uniref:Uncharacterized protein n=1 Tax=Schistosoma margrebowiei TaxID=48269 RepID=A0A183M603_9TREM|nr:unnamed protein product [Schistosoma margrebowiei]VDO95517.1 unnamed protein product [Schistosoma margrebowiei]
MKLKLTYCWKTEQTALQRFNTALLRGTDKLDEFKVALNNRFQALHDLLKEEEITMDNNWKGIKEAETSPCLEVLSRNKHHHN